MLHLASGEGALVLSGVAYAELLAKPFLPEASLNQFLRDTRIQADFGATEALWLEAGRRYAQYALRRRQSGGGEPRRMLADFLVGAHALLQADRLMTLDPARYQKDFPELRLFDLTWKS